MRYAFRGLIRQPRFSIPVILTLALGIGANTAMFTVVNDTLLHPASLRAWSSPERVLTLWETNSHLSDFFARKLPVRPDTYQTWKTQAQSFRTLAAWRPVNVTLTGSGAPEQVEIGAASTELFPLLGIRPVIGRNFSANEVQPVAILSDEVYRSRFQGRANILGATLISDGKPLTIVGVLPPGVAFVDSGPGSGEARPKFWVPLRLGQLEKENNFVLLVYGRLKDGVTAAAGSAEMKVIESRIVRNRKEDDGTGINVIPLMDTAADDDTRQGLLVLQMAVGFVLLIACANAGNLLLTRTASRDREMAIRSALGAGSLRLMGQTFTECLVLSVAAALLGSVFAVTALRVLSSFAPADYATLHHLAPDGYVLAFTIAATLLTALLFGLAPAYGSRRNAINQTLSSASRTSTGGQNRLRSALAITEIAMSVVLVIGAGLLIRSFAELRNTDLGFRIDRLVVMRLALPDPVYSVPEKISAFDRRLLDSVRKIHGVEMAALTTGLPMKALSQSSFEIPGRPKDPAKLPVTNWARVSEDYFETLGVRVLKGRTFTREEVVSADPTVAVVNHAFITTHFPGEEPLGKLATFANEKGVPTTYRIVGVVADEHQMGPDNEGGPEAYFPGKQLRDFLLVARTAENPTSLASVLRQQVWNIDRNLPIAEVESEQAALDQWLAPRRFNTTVLLGFAAIAILLAATGLYSVLAYSVTLRRREIGIRIAVGATPMNVSNHVLRGGLKLSIVGIVTGIAASLAVTRFMESLLFGVHAFDPMTFAAVSALVLLISAAASYLPAARAAKVDPAEALRAE